MGTLVIPIENNLNRKNWLVRPVAWGITPAAVLISLILLLSLGLHLYNIQSIGESNTYYTAAVKSMLQSWHNFFFVSAEPGGSVTVDKPPLGFWIEAAFAGVFGVSGFSVVLPNILAGVLSVGLLYHLVKKSFGAGAGLIAALVLALTPVSLVVDRNNTIDGMLNLTLVLAAWAFLRATESGKLKHLLLGAFLVGLGFNIKMLQAFLPLPAFYALYFLGSQAGWRRKILNLGLASLLLAVVSLAWAVAVDLTPADQRPYVGSTSTNSEMELIFGYNGINRLLGRMGGGARTPVDGLQSLFDRGAAPQAGNNRGGGPGQPAAGGGPGGFDIGNPGPLRFFQAPLAKEMSWLLPFGLVSLVLLAIAGVASLGGLRALRLPLRADEHKAILLWGGWLVTCLVFFSLAGFFHNYYLGTLAPALAALVGAGLASLIKLWQPSRILAALGLAAAMLATLAFQLSLVAQFGLNGPWPTLALALAAIAGLVALGSLFRPGITPRVFQGAALLAVAAALVIPAVWSVKSVAASASTNLPEAYTGDRSSSGARLAFGRQPAGGQGAFPAGPGDGLEAGGVSLEMLAYLQKNTPGMKFMLAVGSSHPGSDLVLQTGRGVLFMGGFTGSDPVVSPESLSQLVAAGELRYILGGSTGGPGGRANNQVNSWIQTNCKLVNDFSTAGSTGRGFNPGGASSLYDCAP